MSSIKGVIKRIEELEIITDSFKKRNLIVTTEGDYPQVIKVEFVQDKSSILDKYAEGDMVEVAYNLRGNEVEKEPGKPQVYNSIHGWKIEKV